VKVLLADADADHVDLLTYAFRREGYTVLTAADGQQAMERWEADLPDAVVLEAVLARIDGFEVCRRIRSARPTPVILLTARDEEEDILRGLRLGADDYVVKPFSPKLLMARMRAVLRRCRADPFRQPASEVQAGDLLLDLRRHQVTKAGQPVRLTPLEFRLLYMLATNAGRVLRYARLVEHAWGYCDEDNSALLKTHMSHLRRKLGLAAGGPGSIQAVLGIGYALIPATAPHPASPD
jgi:DNA-binding response OmpR family regulator